MPDSQHRVKNVVNRIWRVFSRFRQWLHVVGLGDSCAIVFGGPASREIEVWLRPVGRKVAVRANTSDMACLLKVFLSREYVLPFKASPRVIFDAGANIGMATLFFAHEYPDARIVAIEPESSNFALLKRNCASLRNVTLVEAALWPSKGEVALANPNAEKWMFSVISADAAPQGAPRLQAVTIPELLERIGERHIDLLKVDIEGAEKELFTGEPDQWLSKVSIIVIELHDRYRKGCAEAFYSAVTSRHFSHEVHGENTFIHFDGHVAWRNRFLLNPLE